MNDFLAVPPKTVLERELNNPASPARTALTATYLDKTSGLSKTEAAAAYVPKWKATTAYLAGDKVLNPSGDVVSAKVNFTSGASYDSANWNLSTTFATNAALATASNPRRFGRPQFRVIPGGAWSFPSGLDAGATLNTAYADVNPLGTTAAQVVTAGSGSPVLRQTFTAPVDMTGKQWVLWVKLPDMTLTKNLTLYAYDSTLSSANMWTFPVYGPVSTLNSPKYVIHPNVWTPITVPWDPTTTTGAPNRAAVNRVHLGMSDNATGTPVDFRIASKVGMVDVAPAFTNGAVSITIDDSVSLDVVKPKLTQYGYPASLFPIGDTLGTSGRPTVADLRTLVDNLGWEVAAHAATSADHVSVEDLSQADRLANFGRVKAWHAANGFPADVYGWPNGTSSEQAFADLRGFYSVARGVGTGWLETLPPGRPEYLRTVVVSAATTAATINALVDRAVAANCWLILCFHSVVTSGATGQATNQSVFDAIVDYIATKNTKVLTVGDVMAKV